MYVGMSVLSLSDFHPTGWEICCFDVISYFICLYFYFYLPYRKFYSCM